jgi:predicted metalloprotease with PDZ domain
MAQRTLLTTAALALALLAPLTGACRMPPASSERNTTMIRYEVSLSQARAHRVQVRMSVSDPPTDVLSVAMPVWTPGSYLVREFARHVLDLAATDGEGRPLEARKVDKNTWEVATAGARLVRIEYTLYANERSVRTNHVDDGHAFLSPAATFLFVRGLEHLAHHVDIEAPEGWEVFTGLPPRDDGWLALDYDTLVDSPFEIGPHRALGFELEGVPYRIVLAGEGRLDEAQLVQDVRAVAEEVSRIFGHVPYDDYTFIVALVDSGGGGLEHRNSSVCMVSRWSLDKPKDYRGLLSLMAHELFHAWNVKRFRPEALGPFDWDRENYTSDLWVAEGITSYFDDLCVLRAGRAEKVEDYLAGRAKALQELAELPGARRMSLVQASRDAWIKLYRPDENSRNASVSYYSKGALVALLLDLRLRRLTEGRASLETVLRLGWDRYTRQGRGYPDGILGALASEVAGQDLQGFFDAYVRGTEPLDPGDDLGAVGLRLQVAPRKTDRDLPRDEQGFPLAPTLGISTADAGGLVRISAVLEDGPAFEAGLNVDDLILAIDAMRVRPGTLTDRLDRTRGEPAEITFYRGESVRRVTLRPTLERLEDWRLVPVDAPDESQRQAFRSWTGWDLPQAPADADEAPDETVGS